MGLVDDAFVDEMLWITEIDEDAESEAGGFEVVVELSPVNIIEDFDSFDLDDDLGVGYEVGLVILGKTIALVIDFQFGLFDEGDLTSLEFEAESLLVYCFEKSAAELVVDIKTCSNEGV